VRARIAQILAMHPSGIPTHALRAALSERSHACEEAPLGAHQFTRQLGLLLIDGEIDEHDGIWFLRDAHARAPYPHTHDRAA
jgi:hypothetical protein